MANDILYEPGFCQSVVVADPAAPAVGVPVRYGNMTGIAITAIGEGGNDATHTTVNFGPFVCQIPVTATLGAVAAGDPLWYNDAIDGVDNTTTGCPFGMALEAVTSATHTIKVMHVPYPGGFALGAGTVGATQLAPNAVTSAKILAQNVLTAAIADLNVTTGKLAAGVISANAAGRALFAAGVLDATTLLSAVAAGAVVESLVDPISSNHLNLRRTARFVWDFATDAHAVGTVSFRGDTLPAKARIVSGECYIKNALTGAGGTTASIQVTGANDIIADAAVAGVPWSTSDAMVPVVPVNTTATCVKSEAAGGKPSLVITTHDLTAGNIELYLNYIIHD